MTAASLPLRYGRLGWLLGMTGLGRRFSHVELDHTALRVRMGWAFRIEVPRHAIRSTSVDDRNIWWAIGVHIVGRGTWLVNGAAGGVVWLDLEPPVRARTAWFHVTVRKLGVALEDPQLLVGALDRQL